MAMGWVNGLLSTHLTVALETAYVRRQIMSFVLRQYRGETPAPVCERDACRAPFFATQIPAPARIAEGGGFG